MRVKLNSLSWHAAAMLALAMLLGCGEARPVPSVERIDTSTPEGQFEWAMRRLERAVLEFQPSSDDGLHVGKRKVKYELFPPNNQRKTYTAHIVVESETAYVLDVPRDELEGKREERRRARAQEDFERQTALDNPLAETPSAIDQKFTSQMKELATTSRPPRGPEPMIETPEVSDHHEYDLAYLDGRWQLQTEVETDHERLWFEYALEP